LSEINAATPDLLEVGANQYSGCDTTKNDVIPIKRGNTNSYAIATLPELLRRKDARP
jgi:hypothetical protein